MTKIQNTREKIEHAAVQLIAARGVDGVSMRDIATAVGVTEAALYRHFTNKRALVWEIFTLRYDEFAVKLAALQHLHSKLRDKLAVMIGACCAFFDSDRDLFTFLLLAQDIQRLAPQNYKAAFPVMLHELLAVAIKRGEIPAQEIEISSAMIMGAVLQAALYCLYQKPRPKKMMPLAETLASACWRIARGK